jgi:hypothetical protein
MRMKGFAKLNLYVYKIMSDGMKRIWDVDVVVFCLGICHVGSVLRDVDWWFGIRYYI